ncbi:MAG TPA: HupE/UreJ family protein, partial [Devosia sp.]|nr:HupE/UreJ family protein [Devosia sp.]
MQIHGFLPGGTSVQNAILAQTAIMLKGWVVFVLGVLALLAGPLPWVSATAYAHEVQPAIVDLSFSQDGRYRIEIALNLEALIAEIGPDVQNTSESENAPDYNALRSATPDELRRAFGEFEEKFLKGLYLKAGEKDISPQVLDIIVPQIGDLDLARESVIVLGGRLPVDAETFTWAWDFQYGASVVRVAGETPEDDYSAYLVEGQASEPLPVIGVKYQGLAELVLNYIAIGYTHILPKGVDHILFVVGLYLLSTHLRPLLWQVSAFTLAHTITLALGVTGVVFV